MFDIHCITVDCADPFRQARFWSEASGEFCVERSARERGEA